MSTFGCDDCDQNTKKLYPIVEGAVIQKWVCGGCMNEYQELHAGE